MAAWSPQGVAGNVRSPWRRDSLHRRARRTLDKKRRGAVTRDPHRCDQALRNRTTLFFRSTDACRSISPPEHTSTTTRPLHFQGPPHRQTDTNLLMNLRANPSEAQGGICHCVPYNEGDNSGERGKKASRDRARRAHHGHSAQQRLGVGAPFAPSPFRLPLGRPTRGTTDTRRASRKLRLLPSASTHTSCHGGHTSRRQPGVGPQERRPSSRPRSSRPPRSRAMLRSP